MSSRIYTKNNGQYWRTVRESRESVLSAWFDIDVIAAADVNNNNDNNNNNKQMQQISTEGVQG